ncbi:DUF2357 domain-containing protein [Flexilinea flocculi]|jgi:hypothetical protein|uniref:DUF2357 domain-containing protein n=1 Tax=Flexilinea flocculi TaxID=1678840 RepID=A0A0S7BVS9_9CHLR|nr:DUF2357 domain-containing protein [Flexilinea flocculi]GAP40944.1 hypothetical protein ATC1_13926 [Flexilinea flocculi]
MLVKIEVRNRFGDYLGDLFDGSAKIGEYEAFPLKLILFSDQDIELFSLQVGDEFLIKKKNSFILAKTGDQVSGRRGEIRTRVFFKDEHIKTGFIFIRNGNFNDIHYRYLIRDLAKLINIASLDQTIVESDAADLSQEFQNIYDHRLLEINSYVTSLMQIMREISQSPRRTIIKNYHLEIDGKNQKIDSRTIRWNSIHNGQTKDRVITYNNVESYDLYENQFIAYSLCRLNRYLFSLQKDFIYAIDQKIINVKHRLIDFQNYVEIKGGGYEEQLRAQFKNKQIESLKRALTGLEDARNIKLPVYREKIDQIVHKIDQCLCNSFMSNVSRKQDFVLTPSLVLLCDPLYNRVYLHYKKIQEELKLDEREKIEQLLERTPIERTSKLYEYWIFLQVYLELRKMGFNLPDGGHGIESIIDKTHFKLCSGGELRLTGDHELYGYKGRTIEIKINYEKRIGTDESSLLPDIFLEFERFSKKILILDAKYRNYDQQGLDWYQDDIEKTAYHKYKLLETESTAGQWTPIEGIEDLRKNIAASFIIHSHPDFQRFLDYGSGGHANEYGAIPLVPEEPIYNPTPLKRLIKMFLRMQLRIFDVCWSEAHPKPVRAEKVGNKTNGNNSWEGEYRCPVCNNRWWVNHCGHWCKGDGVRVLKITFSDPTDNFFDFDEELRMGEKQVLKCSNCNHGYVKNY